MSTMENGDAVEGLQDKASCDIVHTQKPKGRVNPARWIFGAIARLLIWYTILTALFYCPSNISELGEDSSRICKPYLITRSYLEPHISPVYQAYAAPYVDIVKPYGDGFNQKIYTPTAKFTKDNYAKYGAPRFEKAWEYGSGQWETIAVPRLQMVCDSVTDIYNTSVEPHRKNVVSTINPYYTVAHERAQHLYESYFLPSYLQTKPFLNKAYIYGHDVLAESIFPYVQKVWSLVMAFMDSTVLPRVTGLYSQNVEPQLIRIGQKLASYREGRKLRAVVDEVDSSIEASIASASITSRASVPGAKESNPTEAAPATTLLTPAQQKEKAAEKIATDLKTWQEKFSVAADKGSDDLKERIQEIVGSQLESGAATYGENLVLALEKTAEEQLEGLKTKTNEIVESLPDVCTFQDEEEAQGRLLEAVRSSGIAIREKAHKLREWFSNFDAELVRRASTASESTLDVLDSIRDLGLQEIGMRWAWMDGVTYKDWAKYHALKKQFVEWREEVRDVGMEHEDLKHARSLGSDILSNGMSIAESVAKELSRVKEIGKWKIEARDSSEDFTDRTVAASSVRADKGIPPCSTEEIRSSGTPSSSNSADKQNAEQGAQPLDCDLDDSPVDDGVDRNDNDEGIPSEQDETTRYNGKRNSDSSTFLGGAAAEAMDNQAFTDDIKENPETRFSAPADSTITALESITTSTPGVLEHISSIASSRLQEGLSLASAEFSNAKAAVSTSAETGEHPILMDAQRRYYEALGMAHDRYSVFMDSASEAVFATTTQESEIPASTEEANMPNYQDMASEAQSEFSVASSFVSASSNAVVASVSSAISSMDEETAHSIIDDVSYKYNAALSAASASLTSALSAASAAADSASAQATSSTESESSQIWEDIVSKASQNVYDMPAASEQVQAEKTHEVFGPESDAQDDTKESDEAETESGPEPQAQEPSSVDSTVSSSSSDVVTPTPLVSREVDASSEAPAAVETVLSSVSEAMDSIVDAVKAHDQESSNDSNLAELERKEEATSTIEDVVSSAQTAISSAVYEQQTTSPESAPDAAESSAMDDQRESALESAQSQLDEIMQKAEARLDEEELTQSTSDSSEVVSSAVSTNDEFTSDTSVAFTESTSSARDEL